MLLGISMETLGMETLLFVSLLKYKRNTCIQGNCENTYLARTSICGFIIHLTFCSLLTVILCIILDQLCVGSAGFIHVPKSFGLLLDMTSG